MASSVLHFSHICQSSGQCGNVFGWWALTSSCDEFTFAAYSVPFGKQFRCLKAQLLCCYTDNYMDGEAKSIEPKSLINGSTIIIHHFEALKAFISSHCVDGFLFFPMWPVISTEMLQTRLLKDYLIHFLMAGWQKWMSDILCCVVCLSQICINCGEKKNNKHSNPVWFKTQRVTTK